jgi:hypothetical protein
VWIWRRAYLEHLAPDDRSFVRGRWGDRVYLRRFYGRLAVVLVVTAIFLWSKSISARETPFLRLIAGWLVVVLSLAWGAARSNLHVYRDNPERWRRNVMLDPSTWVESMGIRESFRRASPEIWVILGGILIGVVWLGPSQPTAS